MMGGQTMLEQMRDLINSTGYEDLDVGLKKSELDAILNARKADARILLKERYPDLANMINKKKELKNRIGK